MMMILSLCLFGLVPMANIESHVIHDPPQALSLNDNNQTLIGLNVTFDFDQICIDDAEMMDSMAMDYSSSPIIDGNDDQSTHSSFAEIVSAFNAATMDFRSGMSLKFSHFTESTQALLHEMSVARVYAELKYLVFPKPQPVTLKSLANEAFDRTLWEFQQVHDWCLSLWQDMFPPPPPPSFWEEPITVSFKQLRVTINGLFGRPSLPPPPRTFGAIARDCWNLFSAWYEKYHELLKAILAIVVIAVVVALGLLLCFMLIILVLVAVINKALTGTFRWWVKEDGSSQEQQEEEQSSSNREEPRPNFADPAVVERVLAVLTTLRALGLSWNDFADCEDSEAELRVLRRAYRRRCLDVHPDQGGSNEDFHFVSDSYQYLVRYIENGNTLKIN